MTRSDFFVLEHLKLFFYNMTFILHSSFYKTSHLLLESGVAAMEADLDLWRMASLCFALLEAVLPNSPGLGDRLLVKLENIFWNIR